MDARRVRQTGVAALIVVAATAVDGAADAQNLPCVYTGEGGTIVITDSAEDPNCPDTKRVAAASEFQPPGRLRVDVAIAEAISLAHDAAIRYRVDHRLVESLVEMESGFNPRAISKAGAMGLMQLMPAVAKDYGVTDPLNGAENVDAGVRHLRMLLLRYTGDVELALAAYNAGPGAVDKYGGVPPYPETQQYVRRVLYRYRQRVDGRPLH